MHILTKFEELEKTVRELNPNAKRTDYGPFSQYVTPTLSYHTLRAYGVPYDEKLSELAFPGFSIFEDYPFSCAYHTYRGPFAIMTILLHSPKMVIYPEQYTPSAIGGCVDGAVKYAHGPMGKYSLEFHAPLTQAYEYVFNTARREEGGYRYWDTYGFHRRDYRPSLAEIMTIGWKKVVDYKPKKPLKALAYIAEYTNLDNTFEEAVMADGNRKFVMGNKSEIGSGLIHECSRVAGVPNGFALKFETLKHLKADECDLLVVPSLAEATKEYIGEIRRLYNEGVNLIAVSDVTGLEDLFGVEKAETEADIDTLCYEGREEYIYPNTAGFMYKPAGAETIVTAKGGIPAVMRTERATIVNADVTALGAENKSHAGPVVSLHIVGNTVRQVLRDEIKRLSKPLALGENIAVSLFETEKGKTVLAAINYTPHDNKERVNTEAKIKLNIPEITKAKSDRKLFCGRKNGVLSELRFEVKPYETVFIELY